MNLFNNASVRKAMNKDKLKSAILSFVKNKKANAAYYDDNWKERFINPLPKKKS